MKMIDKKRTELKKDDQFYQSIENDRNYLLSSVVKKKNYSKYNTTSKTVNKNSANKDLNFYRKVSKYELDNLSVDWRNYQDEKSNQDTFNVI
jgi:hypothetical protein